MTDISMTSININSSDQKINPPPLAQYKPLSEYLPEYGDYVIWSGLFTVKHGFVLGLDVTSGKLNIVFENLPVLLLTMIEEEYGSNTKQISLGTIKKSRNGTYAIQQKIGNSTIWYI